MSNKSLELEEPFLHNFECKHLEQLPHSLRQHYYYPGGTTEGGRDGLIVEVSTRSSESWIGTFAFGTISPKGKNGLYAWPDPRILCVVSQGQGYLVWADEPTKSELIRVDPVLDVMSVPAKQIVVFANYTQLIAYGKSGPVWVTNRLSWDGLKLTKLNNDYIEGEVWDPRVEANVGFKVDLSNGHHEGGSYDG
ncbi:MAG TPA: hypothetical protein VKC61_00300 [Pyrinomonadaceae bacterium]|nr:hypothetical protein [Pyrinomonadaceae bacterium]